jgi:hypothetical protein
VTDDRETQMRWVFLAPVCLILLIGMYLQLNTYPNHDVAWILWGTQRMLHGARFGIDIVEPNPPLAWYLAMPSTMLAELVRVPLDQPFRLFVAIAAALSSLAFARIGAEPDEWVRQSSLAAAAAAILVLLPGREFAQREHLLLVAMLPYLALTSRRLASREFVRGRWAFFLGTAAGIGFALKPYFLAVPIIVEAIVQLTAPRRPRLLRAENLGIAAVGIAYAAVLLLFERPYFEFAVPLAREIYWSFDSPMSTVWPALVPQAVAVAALSAVAFVRRDWLGIVVVAAWSGLAISYLAQQKGYAYHIFPAVAVTLLLAAVECTAARMTGLLRASIGILVVLLVVKFIPPTVDWWKQNRPGGPHTVEIEEILASIDRNATGGDWLVVAVHPYPAFPAAIYASAQYSSRTNSQWFLPATVQLRARNAPAAARASIERHARDFMLHDLQTRPGLVLIDSDASRHTVSNADFDFVQFYREDPRFRCAWADYREIARIGQFRQFVLREQGKRKITNLACSHGGS